MKHETNFKPTEWEETDKPEIMLPWGIIGICVVVLAFLGAFEVIHGTYNFATTLFH